MARRNQVITNERRLLISFSGGETSARMTRLILERWQDRYDQIAIVFANTSLENEETLIFADQCDRLLFQPLGGRVVWIEGEQVHGERKAPTVRIVDFDTARRKGEVFEDYIRKYGIPNAKFKGCTRSMKRYPIEQYAKHHLGWTVGTYDTAIGIRADEMDRISMEKDKRRILYPLISEWPTTKPQINTWFAAQPFRLQLKGYQGNCQTCWKKSFRKLMTIADESPEKFDFMARMERDYGRVGPEFLKDAATNDDAFSDYRRTFFRGNRSVQDIFTMLAEHRVDGTFAYANDDATVYDEELDVGGGCGSESCEVWTEDSEDQLGFEETDAPVQPCEGN